MARRKCSTTGKDRFPSKLEAELAIADIQRRNKSNRRRKFREEPSRSYRCEFCGTYHLTSQSKNEESPDRGSLTPRF